MIALACCLPMLFVAAGVPASGAAPPASLELTLPPEFYGVPGVPVNVYFDNVVLTSTPTVYRFVVDCGLGTTSATHWTSTPTADDVGDHPWKLTVTDRRGKTLATAAMTFRVAPATAGQQESIRLLIVGDSLTHATLYPNELARLLSLPDNPKWTMLGTHRPPATAPGVAHEGYAGWTWIRFATHFEPHPDGTYRKRSSPFVFLNAAGAPTLDVNRYFDELCGGKRPDYVTFLLGINDCFSANPDRREAMDASIDAMFKYADQLVTAFRRAAPDAELGICLTPPPNSREEAFDANYRGAFHRWGWKRIQHRLVQRELEHFGNRRQDNIFLIPTELNLDPVSGFPPSNGVHPNATGYRQIAATLYAWLKFRLAARGR